MKNNARRILRLSAVLALIGLLMISTAAFAMSPNAATQAQLGARGAYGYGAGDGTGPIVGGSFGPGPKGVCIDLNNNGICDCQE